MKKVMIRVTRSRVWPGSQVRAALTLTSDALPSNTVVAADSGVPRFHSLTMRG